MQLLGALPATALHHHTSPLHNEQKEAFLELQDTGADSGRQSARMLFLSRLSGIKDRTAEEMKA